MTLLLLVSLTLLSGTETCPPPDLSASASAADNAFLYEAPFLAMESPVEDPGPEAGNRDAVLARVLRERLAAMEREVGGRPEHTTEPAGTTWIYSYASGWLRVPSALQVRVAAVGVDGSWVLEMADAAGHLRLQASGTGACVGCAMGAAALWFPEQVETARNNEFLYCERFVPAPEILTRSAHRVQWQRRDPLSGAMLQGVVVDRTADDEGLQTLTISGLDAEVTRAVLDGFGA